jgi:hypothetical protein
MVEQIVTGAPLGPRVTSVTPTDDYKLYLTFSNGERRVFDATALLRFPVFKPLENKQFFKSVRVEYGTVAWPQDIDYCPDTLYRESLPHV